MHSGCPHLKMKSNFISRILCPQRLDCQEHGIHFQLADACEAGGGEMVPAMLESPDYILRGYSAENRIVYGTGGVVATEAIPARAGALLADPRVAYVHVRSARNNCFQVRVERA